MQGSMPGLAPKASVAYAAELVNMLLDVITEAKFLAGGYGT